MCVVNSKLTVKPPNSGMSAKSAQRSSFGSPLRLIFPQGVFYQEFLLDIPHERSVSIFGGCSCRSLPRRARDTIQYRLNPPDRNPPEHRGCISE